MDAFPLQTFPGTMATPRFLWGTAVAAAVVLSIWLLVAAGLQRYGPLDGTVPGPLPEAPAIVRADLSASDVEIMPAPGVDIAPVEGSLSPR